MLLLIISTSRSNQFHVAVVALGETSSGSLSGAI